MNNYRCFIPQYFIKYIVKKINLVEYISKYIPVKKKGKHFYANCPFHLDRTPSFIINEEKSFYYCFGCKVTGNVINFHQKMHPEDDFITSILYLSAQYNIKIESLFPTQHKVLVFPGNVENEVLKKINNFFLSVFYKLKDSQNINNFLITNNLSLESLKNFDIGYCPVEPYRFKNFINTLNNEEVTLLQERGLIKYYNNIHNISCIFKKRLIFPILDYKGRILGFGGRDLDSNSAYKYINSPNSRCFDKQKILYGLSQVLQKDPYPKKILVVEGYLDVISLHQYGIYYAVGLLGTNLSHYQLTLLLNKTKHLIFCYDGDLAGRSAAWDTIKKIIPYIKDEHNINFVFLPDKEDPHSLINKENKIDFESRLDKATPFFDYIFNELYKDIKPNNIYSQIMFSKKFMKFIKPMQSRFFKSYLIYKLKNTVKFVDLNLFSDQDNQLYKYKLPTIPTFRDNLILLISLLIQNPTLYKLATPLLSLINKNKNIKFFINLVNICNINDINNTGQLLEFFREDTNLKHIKRLAVIEYYIAPNKLNKVFVDLIYYFHKIYLKSQLYELINIEKTTGLNQKNKEKILEISKKLHSLKNI